MYFDLSLYSKLGFVPNSNTIRLIFHLRNLESMWAMYKGQFIVGFSRLVAKIWDVRDDLRVRI